jgi:hypothetical protein
MSKYRRIDLSKIRTIKFENRHTKADVDRFGRPFRPQLPFSEFLLSLPDYLRAGDLLILANEIAEARSRGAAVIWMMGAHPLKVGLSPIINDLIEGGYVTHLAVNGAFAIHDLEIAFFGRTSEEVIDGLSDGSFGMVEETPRLIFEAAARAAEDGLGLGEGLGMYVSKESPKFAGHSVFKTCYVNGVPASVHVAIGTDTISQHPGFDGGLFGRLSADDFLVFCDSVSHLSGGAVINFGSAVILPEVFLKALTVARNITGSVKDFSAANFDMIQHYRPNTNVVSRPVAAGGRGYSFTGHHELMLPLLAAAIKSHDVKNKKG